MKPRVLMIAYACNPQGTGEHWLGWGWAEQAAKNFQVDLITTPKSRAEVEQSSRAAGITPHFVDVPPAVRKWTERAGGSWLRKLSWQKEVLRLAARLHQEKKFVLAHQTTFHTFRVPFLAARLGIPSVWGPIAGGEHVPPGFERYLGPARASEFGRGLFNRLWLQSPGVKRSLREASLLFVSNQTTLNFLPPDCRAKARIVAPNALRAEDERCAPPSKTAAANAPFRLLYVGNCVATRAIPIVLEALAQSELADYEFSIIGAGPALDDWKTRAAALGVAAKVKFVGKVPYQQLNEFYAAADVLVFPAMRDSGGSALLEAMARYLPVICLDWGGPGEMVDSRSGIKVSVDSPEAAVKGFAEALVRLQRDPGLRYTLAAAARVRAEANFGWAAKRKLLEDAYQSLIRP